MDRIEVEILRISEIHIGIPEFVETNIINYLFDYVALDPTL